MDDDDDDDDDCLNIDYFLISIMQMLNIYLNERDSHHDNINYTRINYLSSIYNEYSFCSLFF